MGWLLVGVDASLPLHRALLLAGLGSSERRGARRRCHGGRWDSAVLGGSLELAGQTSQQQPNVIKQRAASAASPVQQRIIAWCSSLEKLLLPGGALKPQHTAAPPRPLEAQIKVEGRAQRWPSCHPYLTAKFPLLCVRDVPPSAIPVHHAGPLWVVCPTNALLMLLLPVLERRFLLRKSKVVCVLAFTSKRNMNVILPQGFQFSRWGVP